ncbi:hypothetical protein T02_12442 [Trichinella nativa]|uniref:Uncharacterized protein n=1 Tax=Trichinella nativa TaxID=6335 RepID=A0A0V1LNP3_9BILA|nr:hypothetical protein T02_12442 [Trichinella nativa]
MEMITEKLIEAEEGSQKFDTRTSRIPKVLRFYSVQRFNVNFFYKNKKFERTTVDTCIPTQIRMKCARQRNRSNENRKVNICKHHQAVRSIYRCVPQLTL